MQFTLRLVEWKVGTKINMGMAMFLHVCLNEQMEVGICIPSAPPHLFASPTCLRKQHHDVGVLGQSEVMDALRIPGF